MKTFIIAAALLATVATSASAMSLTLLPNVETTVTRLAPNADVTNLKTSQIAALNSMFVNSNDLRNDIDRGNFIKNVLGWH
jgi:hypothetical protein